MVTNSPLLTRKQELQLLTSIECEKRKLFKQCVKYQPFRQILTRELQKTLKNTLSTIPSNPPIISKATTVSGYTKKFKTILKGLQSSDSAKHQTEITKVKTTGNIACYVLELLKKEFRQVEMSEFMHESLAYFTVEETKRLFLLARRCIIDSNMLQVLAERINKHPSDVLSRLQKIDSFCAGSKPKNIPLASQRYRKSIKKIFHYIQLFEIRTQPSRHAVIEANLRLVVARAKAKIGRGLSFQDLVQAGNLGLMKAVEKFDSSLNFKLSTFVTWWIDQSMQREIQNKARVIKVPVHVQGLMTNIQDLKNTNLPQSELARKLGVNESVIETAKNAIKTSVSLECELAEGYTLANKNHQDANEMSDPFFNTYSKIQKERLQKALSELRPETEKLIRLKFGLGLTPDKMDELKGKIGCSQANILD